MIVSYEEVRNIAEIKKDLWGAFKVVPHYYEKYGLYRVYFSLIRAKDHKKEFEFMNCGYYDMDKDLYIKGEYNLLEGTKYE